MTQKRFAFTLIELLVVMAIIGTISAIVIRVLNIGRDKGIDTNLRANLDASRAQAELFFDNNNEQYNAGTAAQDVCSISADGSQTRGVRGIYSSVIAAARADSISSVSLDTTPGPTVVVCNSTVGKSGGWAVQIPLKFQTGFYYCVDSTGQATTTATGLTNGTDVTC